MIKPNLQLAQDWPLCAHGTAQVLQQVTPHTWVDRRFAQSGLGPGNPDISID